VKIKKYLLPIIIGAIIGLSLSGLIDTLLSFEIMVKAFMQSSSNFKLVLGAFFGAFCAWIIVYNRN
jgi:uncharacterized membrane protein (DUF4010 family)